MPHRGLTGSRALVKSRQLQILLPPRLLFPSPILLLFHAAAVVLTIAAAQLRSLSTPASPTRKSSLLNLISFPFCCSAVHKYSTVRYRHLCRNGETSFLHPSLVTRRRKNTVPLHRSS